MTPERWNYLKNLQPLPGVLVWNSSRQGTCKPGFKAAKREMRAMRKELTESWFDRNMRAVSGKGPRPKRLS